MLHPTALRSLLQSQPFRAFRIVLNSGKTYDIRHPESLIIGKSWATIYEAVNPGAEFPDRFHLVSLMLMEHTEFLDPKATATTQSESA
jgi:hypothetical protein